MAELILGINTCFAIGRYPEPEEWLRVVTDELGLSHVQFSFDLLDPVIVDWKTVTRTCERIASLAAARGVRIDTATTGEIPHKSNAMLDPDPAVRACWLRWYENLVRASSILGAEGAGVYLGTLTVRDHADPVRREYLISVLMEEIAHLTRIAREGGQQYFMWEPMSIPREIPCTIEETKQLLERANRGVSVPVVLCLDVGHGWIRSPDPRDRDPYAWLRELGHLSPAIHMQQTDGKGSRHWPFTPEWNEKGLIVPEKVAEALRAAGAEKSYIYFEYFFSAHAIAEEGALDSMRQSVEHWKKGLARAGTTA
jgi:D-erythrulose 1-phosphate 3-epimerase